MFSTKQIADVKILFNEYNALRQELAQWSNCTVPLDHYNIELAPDSGLKIEKDAFLAAKEKMIQKLTEDMEAKERQIYAALQASPYGQTEFILLAQVNKYLDLLRLAYPHIESLNADNIHDPSVGLRRDEDLADLFRALKDLFEPCRKEGE